MSYNITELVTKTCTIKIPLDALYSVGREDWRPDNPELQPDGSFIISCGCEQDIIGDISENILTINELNMSGEGSGTFMNEVFEPALKQSMGELIAVRIWEAGDSIDKLIVKDGDVKTEKVEL